MESVLNNTFKVLSMDEINKLNEEEAREYLINMLNSIPGLKYGHIYNKNEKIYMRNEYNKFKMKDLNKELTLKHHMKLNYVIIFLYLYQIILLKLLIMI